MPSSLPPAPLPLKPESCYNRRMNENERKQLALGAHRAFLASSAELMGCIKSKWTAKQAQYAASASKFSTRLEVAKHHGVSPSTVTESLQAANYNAIRHAEEARAITLRKIEKLEKSSS